MLRWPLIVNLSVVVGLLVSLPGLFATFNCVTSGKYCQYAVIGPDRENVIPNNIRKLNSSLIAGEKSPVVEIVRHSSGVFGRRFDVSIKASGENLIVDSRKVSSFDQLKIVDNFPDKSSVVVFENSRFLGAGPPTFSILLYRIAQQLSVRAFQIECHDVNSYFESSDLKVSNLVWHAPEKEILLDVVAGCSSLSVNGQFFPKTKSTVFDSGDRGSVVSLKLDEDFLLASASSKLDLEEERSQNSKNARLSSCLGAYDADAEKAKRVAYLGVCKESDYIGQYFSSDTRLIVSDGAGTTDYQYIHCLGAQENELSPDKQYAFSRCIKNTAEAPYRQAIDINVRSASGLELDFTVQCECASVSVSGIEVGPTGISFSLAANASKVRMNGQDIVLRNKWSGAADVNPPMPQGRYKVMLSPRWDVLEIVRD